jgi:hypothetical protein
MTSATEWECEDCGWPQPTIAGPPTDESECDNCGGQMVPVTTTQEDARTFDPLAEFHGMIHDEETTR